MTVYIQFNSSSHIGGYNGKEALISWKISRVFKYKSILFL